MELPGAPSRRATWAEIAAADPDVVVFMPCGYSLHQAAREAAELIKRPEVARKFMVAYLKGVRFYNDALSGKASRDELVAILTKSTSVKKPELYAKMAFPGLHPNGTLNTAGMEYDVKWWVSAGRMKESVDVATIVDASYAAYAVQQLGPYK